MTPALRALVASLLLVVACGEQAPVSPSGAPSDRPAESPPAAAGPRLGLWVLAQGSRRPLEHELGPARLLEQARRLGATDLFVQLYREGRSWYPSPHADSAPYDRMAAGGGADRLRQLADGAHAQGIRVHAWFNALALHANPEAPLLQRVGREGVLVDRLGRSLLDYPGFDVPEPDRRAFSLGTPGIWLDPAVPAVSDALADEVRALVAAAPWLDGLHLDFIRYPMALPLVPGSRFEGLDFGYGEQARTRFAREHGGRFERGDAWDEFRRVRVTELVERLGGLLPPGWERSAAVIAYADRAYLSALQDWRAWLEDGLLDFAVAMVYTRDDRLLRQVAHGLRGGLGGERVWIGLGAWLFASEPARIERQIGLAREVEPVGIALFSYDALEDAPDALAALSRQEAAH
jgi:uncharacterized lipoprotein YddW (UPF0748 family)